MKLTDGSLSDTQAYAEVKTDYSSYAMWLKHSNTASSRLSEGDSLESLGIGSPRGHKMIHRESPYSNSPRLNRSNSIRYTTFTPIRLFFLYRFREPVRFRELKFLTNCVHSV